MTSLRPIDLVCPVCDTHFRSQAVVSTNSFGGKRTDFHESAAGHQPLPYLLHTCSGCGYTGVERGFVEGSEVTPGICSRVLTEITPLLAAGSLSLPSERYEAAARIASWQGEPARRIADLLLRAAWCCVDDNDREGERYFRRAAAERFAEALESIDGVPPADRAVLTYLTGELWRRIGHDAEAHRWFTAVATEIIDPVEQAWVLTITRQQRTDPREWFD